MTEPIIPHPLRTYESRDAAIPWRTASGSLAPLQYTCEASFRFKTFRADWWHLGEPKIGGKAPREEQWTSALATSERYTPITWAPEHDSLGTTMAGLGEQEMGIAWFEEAIAAYRAALQERTRDRVPLDWATTQTNVGTALAMFGERENNTVQLEEAVAAYRAALEERTRERVPLQWAMTTGNQGVAMKILADRTNDAALAEAAVRQLEAAYETMQSGGQEQWEAYFYEQLGKARRIRDRIKGQSDEPNWVNGEASVVDEAKEQ
jgi:tetratricopeptide (TPR) repeat protein